MKNRRGISLIEVVVALAVLGLPFLVILTMIQSCMLGARHDQDRTTSRMVLADLTGLLNGESVEKLRELGAGDTTGLDLMLEGRIAGLPPGLRDRFRSQVKDLFGAMRLTVEEDFGGIHGMMRLTLTARLSRNATATLSWYLRPAARVDFRPPDR